MTSEPPFLIDEGLAEDQAAATAYTLQLPVGSQLPLFSSLPLVRLSPLIK